MAQQAICPACGAPITYEGNQDRVQCGHCGTSFEVKQEDGQEKFQVLSQPGPQKEVLSHPVEGSLGEGIGGAAVYEIDDFNKPTELLNAIPENPYTSAGPEDPYGASRPDTMVDSSIPVGRLPEQNFSPVFSTASTPVSPAVRSGVPRWVWIVVAALLSLCVVCACLAGALLIYNRSQ